MLGTQNISMVNDTQDCPVLFLRWTVKFITYHTQNNHEYLTIADEDKLRMDTGMNAF
jgi:hypothetical protein